MVVFNSQRRTLDSKKEQKRAVANRRLLLADDSITIQKVVNLTFADEGIDVTTTADGDSAIQKINESLPDVVLADVHMPGLNGYQVCEQIRANEATRSLPVLLLVGSFEPFDEAEAERVGASGYLTKPFQSIRQLVSKVSELMETAAPAKTAPSAGDGAESVGDLPAEHGQYAVSENAPTDKEPGHPDANDIEALYKESFTDTDDSTAVEDVSPTFVDAGMDDEMIETRYSADTGVSGQDDISESAEQEFEHPSERFEADEPSAEIQPSTGFDQFSETERIPPDFNFDPENGYSSATELGDRAPVASHAGDFEANEQLPGEPTADYKFDDMDLLELPPVSGAETVEFTTPQDAVEQGSTKQVVTLSPELMDLIVQRVVEKLSEKY